jgi:hypothetical protein
MLTYRAARYDANEHVRQIEAKALRKLKHPSRLRAAKLSILLRI